MSLDSLEELLDRLVDLMVDAEYTQNYYPMDIEKRGAYNQDKLFNVYLEELGEDPESPANARDWFAIFKILVIRVTGRSNATLKAINIEMKEILKTLSDPTEGDFDSSHIQMIPPATMHGEPLSTNAMFYEIQVQHHYREE